MKAIWTEDEASTTASSWTSTAIWSWPKPAQWPHPPVLVGGNGPTVLDRVLAFGDAWMPNYIPGEDLAARIEELRSRADRHIDVVINAAPAKPEVLEEASRRWACGGSSATSPPRGSRPSRRRSTAGRRRSPNCTGSEVDGAQARERFARAPVARLASVGGDGRPHIVPVVFVLDRETIYSVVDRKPKRTERLKRLENLRARPAAALLADHYDEDWSRLWWVRADGRARVLDGDHGEAERAVVLLSARYPQQRAAGAVLAVDVERWSGWSAAAG